MDRNTGSTVLALTLLFGVLIQVLLVAAESIDTPNKTAVAFSKAYFKLDPAMGKYLCSELAESEDADIVGRYIQNRVREARNRGFDRDYVKSYIYHVTTETLSKSEESARIRIHCKRRKHLNPVYAIIARFFFIGNTYTVDEEIELVKENGKWRVCGEPFSLT